MVVDDAVIEVMKWVTGLILVPSAVWFWKRHERDHEKLEAEQKQLKEATRKLQEATSMGYSTLNDRVMEHVDNQVREVRQFVVAEDTRLMTELSVQRTHIGKIFDKMEAHAQRSEDRHIETMSAIHTLATTMHQALATKADK